MDKPQNSTLLNICIIPDERVSEACISISQPLGSGQTMFVLGNGKFAHMTVYMARFANDNVPKVVRAVEEAVKQTKVFRCEHTGFFMTDGRYLEVSYRKSPDLVRLHESLISHCADLRMSPDHPFIEGYFAPYTPDQQKSAEETGYDLARDLYRPHITLTRYHEGGAPAVLPDLPAVDLSFEASKVCVYKADDNGAVYELIKEFQVA